jgi:K+-transporting ATPase c subunit
MLLIVCNHNSRVRISVNKNAVSATKEITQSLAHLTDYRLQPITNYSTNCKPISADTVYNSSSSYEVHISFMLIWLCIRPSVAQASSFSISDDTKITQE